jgi:hypothetical protein
MWKKNLSYTPGTSYGGWYGYRNYSEGYYTEDQTFYVETNFYSFPENMKVIIIGGVPEAPHVQPASAGWMKKPKSSW